MNYLNMKRTIGLLALVGASIAGVPQSWGATVNVHLKAGLVPKTMPDGTVVQMWGFGDATHAVDVPGPVIRANAGDTLNIYVTPNIPVNKSEKAISVVIPGQPGIHSMSPVLWEAGSPFAGRIRSLDREFLVSNTEDATPLVFTDLKPGTYLYHSGTHPAVQVQMGLYGALVVDAAPATGNSATLAYAGAPYERDAVLLYSEIDPLVHTAVHANTYGPGPSFQSGDFSNVGTFMTALGQAATAGDTFAIALQAQLNPAPADAAGLVSALNAILAGPSIADPSYEAWLSPAALAELATTPLWDTPISSAPHKTAVVHLNRTIMQEGLQRLQATYPALTPPTMNTMSSTVRSSPRYFLVNGKAYDPNQLKSAQATPLATSAAFKAGSTLLLRFLNAGMDAHVPTLVDAGDLHLIAEDAKLYKFPRDSYSVFLPAMKTVDALWTVPVALNPDRTKNFAAEQFIAVYDRRLGLVNENAPDGGMYTYLHVNGSRILFSSQPQSITVNNGATAHFDATVFNPLSVALTANWYRTGGSSPIATQNSSAPSATFSLNVPNVSYTTDNGASFYVVVSAAGQTDLTSQKAILTVNPIAPHLVLTPANGVITPNPLDHSTAFELRVTVDNADATVPITWSWQRLVSGNWVAYTPPSYVHAVTGVTAGLTYGALQFDYAQLADAGSYRAIAFNAAVPVTGVTSAAFSFAVDLPAAPSIGSIVVTPYTTTFAGSPFPPASGAQATVSTPTLVIATGNNPLAQNSAVKGFTLAASGFPADTALTYHWYKDGASLADSQVLGSYSIIGSGASTLGIGTRTSVGQARTNVGNYVVVVAFPGYSFPSTLSAVNPSITAQSAPIAWRVQESFLASGNTDRGNFSNAGLGNTATFPRVIPGPIDYPANARIQGVSAAVNLVHPRPDDVDVMLLASTATVNTGITSANSFGNLVLMSGIGQSGVADNAAYTGSGLLSYPPTQVGSLVTLLGNTTVLSSLNMTFSDNGTNAPFGSTSDKRLGNGLTTTTASFLPANKGPAAFSTGLPYSPFTIAPDASTFASQFGYSPTVNGTRSPNVNWFVYATDRRSGPNITANTAATQGNINPSVTILVGPN